jgi:hypothetical protein
MVVTRTSANRPSSNFGHPSLEFILARDKCIREEPAVLKEMFQLILRNGGFPGWLSCFCHFWGYGLKDLCMSAAGESGLAMNLVMQPQTLKKEQSF